MITSYTMSMSNSAGRQTPKRSSLGLMVLWQLIGEPMHTYRMQKLIEAQGKHRVVNVRSPASLYQTIKRLEHHGLVEVKETIHGSSQPDRTVYTITDQGRDTAREWLGEMLVKPVANAGVHRCGVDPVRAAPRRGTKVVEERAERVAVDLAQAADELAANPGLPRLFLLEEEYRRAVLQAGWPGYAPSQTTSRWPARLGRRLDPRNGRQIQSADPRAVTSIIEASI